MNLKLHSQVNYVEFHKKISLAEQYVLDSNYSNASRVYFEAFQQFDFVFLGNCITACQTAIKSENDSLAFYFLERGVKHGLKLSSIKSDGLLQKLVSKSSWNDFEKKYDSLRTIYINAINWELRGKINELHALDQKWRNKHELHSWNFLWRPIIGLQWRKVVRRIVENELMPLINKYGYPGQRLIGVEEQGMNKYLTRDHYTSFMVRLIFIHYFSFNSNLDGAFFIDEIKKGNLNPKQFAEFQDFRAHYSTKNTKYKNQYYCQWMSNLGALKGVLVEDINRRRAEIGLGTYEQRIKELNYFFACRKESKVISSLTNVAIFY
jgi:hypothetical protein